jgi:putative membrane protein
MGLLHRAPKDDEQTSTRTNGVTPEVVPASESGSEVPLTRAGAAWVAVSAAAVCAVLLIIFLVQNTHRVQVSFLWMSTSTSLALMLLIAAVAGILMTVVLGTTRIVQLRRVIRGADGR